MSTSQRSVELGNFLRIHRDRLQPEDVGLPGGGRRRVPGLRREEVAVLANVGTTWYTWLEQGRDVVPSADVLAAIAGALRLRPDEQRLLFHLAGHSPTELLGPVCQRPGSRVHDVLAALSPWPAVLLTPSFDLVAWNVPYRFLIEDVETLPPAQRNAVWLHFNHPAWQLGHRDHPDDYAAIVARLRAAYGYNVDDERWDPLIGRLRESSDRFAMLWDRGDATRHLSTVKHVMSPRVGPLELLSTPLNFDETDAFRLFVYTPATPASRAKLLELEEMLRLEGHTGPAGSAVPPSAPERRRLRAL